MDKNDKVKMKQKELFANIFISHSLINKYITLHKTWKH